MYGSLDLNVNEMIGNFSCQALNTDSLTHLPLDKMATISETIFSDAILWMKSFVFWLKFHWRLFVKVQTPIDNNRALV